MTARACHSTPQLLLPYHYRCFVTTVYLPTLGHYVRKFIKIFSWALIFLFSPHYCYYLLDLHIAFAYKLVSLLLLLFEQPFFTYLLMYSLLSSSPYCFVYNNVFFPHFWHQNRYVYLFLLFYLSFFYSRLNYYYITMPSFK